MYNFKKGFIYFQRKVKGGIKRGRDTSMGEKNTNVLPLICAPPGGQTYNPGTCPDGEKGEAATFCFVGQRPTN